MTQARWSRLGGWSLALAILMALTGIQSLGASPVAADRDNGWEQVATDSVRLLQEYVRIKTVNPPADVREAAAFLKQILSAEQIAVELFESEPGKVNLLARFPATAPGKNADGSLLKPIMLLHHMDVVPVDSSRWSDDPFSGRLEDDFVHGRGAMDMKGIGIIHLQAMLELKRRGTPTTRDILFLATPDEETGGHAGVSFLIQNHWEKLQPEYVLDEGGFGTRDLLAADGRLIYGVSNVEKRVFWLRLSATGTAAHGSQPLKDNAVERLQGAIGRILAWRDENSSRGLPRELRALAEVAERLADNKFTRAIRADTISLTTFRAGVGEPPKANVIPSSAEATLDCRLLPGTDPGEFLARIEDLAGEGVEVETIYLSRAAPATPAHASLFQVIKKVVEAEVEGARVAPIMIPYGTDSNTLRAKGVKAFGFLPVEVGADVVASMHGDAEKFPAAGLGRGVRLMYLILEEFLAP